MRRPLFVASVLCGMIMSLTGRCEAPSLFAAGKRPGLTIKVDERGWGAVNPGEIATVLYSVADTLLSRTANAPPMVVRVSHTDSNPVALYDRGPGGEYVIKLHASRDKWHLYVYEFAHEFCHILSNFDRAGADVARHNQWFEETLCETASLYALGSLAEQWALAPPEPRLSGYAGHLRRFFGELVAERHRNLPAGTPLGEWLHDHEAGLSEDPYQREQNDLVAKSVLPLFFVDPNAWDAITYLNLHPGDAFASLQEFMQHWYANAPERDRPFVAKLSAMLLKADETPVRFPAAALEKIAQAGR